MLTLRGELYGAIQTLKKAMRVPTPHTHTAHVSPLQSPDHHQLAAVHSLPRVLQVAGGATPEITEAIAEWTAASRDAKSGLGAALAEVKAQRLGEASGAAAAATGGLEITVLLPADSPADSPEELRLRCPDKLLFERSACTARRARSCETSLIWQRTG